ncbi:hypothetical protein IFM89_030497 [Coptis chinensis]|uniref:Uncharacterized protein n=1 Tax=Coptis chinensis TaxID=261450 RepID=A0A835LG80_9MAGN|nr:hypothetical protein IFM89_030497 [Coptis chinensis]
MIDCDIVGGNWIEVPVGKYKKAVRTMSYYCQLEFDCLYPYAPEVANLVTLQGESQPFVRNIMTLKSYSPIVGADVMPFENEREKFYLLGGETGTTLLPPVQDCLENRIEICNP